MLKSNERVVKCTWVSPNGSTSIVDAYEIVNYKRKQHSKYSFAARNYGKDFIYQARLRLVAKMGAKRKTKASSRFRSYVMEAELGIILD